PTLLFTHSSPPELYTLSLHDALPISVEAAEPLGVPVFPVVAYGITPYFRAFPGSITLRVDTYLRVVGDILDAMAEQGFKNVADQDRKSTRLNSSHVAISYAVFCLKKK